MLQGSNSLAEHVVAVTPSDSNNQPFDALYVGITGDVAIMTRDGTNVTFTGVAVGFFPVSGLRILSTGTTASNIIALS